jgi:hypothetical protein
VKKLLGVVLVAVGAFALYFKGVPYTHTEPVVDLGPLHVSSEKHDLYAVPPVLSAAVVALGLLLLVLPPRE